MKKEVKFMDDSKKPMEQVGFVPLIVKPLLFRKNILIENV